MEYYSEGEYQRKNRGFKKPRVTKEIETERIKEENANHTQRGKSNDKHKKTIV